MSNDSERFLEQLIPRGAPASLRERVLGEVTRALAARPPARWPLWLALAASLLLGIALNLGLEKVQQARLAEIYGPEPVPHQLAEMTRTIRAVTDEQTASWFRQELLKALRRRPAQSRDQEKYWIDYYSQILGKEIL